MIYSQKGNVHMALEATMAIQQPLWGDIFPAPTAMTAQELLRLPGDSKNELYEGMVVREEMTAAGHGDICLRLGGELYIYARANGYQHTIVQNTLFDFTPPGAIRRTVLAPDLAIMRGTGPFAWDLVPTDPPLLAVEVVSSSQTLAELAVKARIYQHAGVEESWLIDHQTRLVEVWTATGMQSLTDGQTLTSPLVPGFSIAITFLLDG
jgi:Uma2 family endonuclease